MEDENPNIIVKAYKSLDSSIMGGINQVVRAYNWTTGGTKAELANGLLTAAPIMESLGIIIGYHEKENLSSLYLLGIPLFILDSHLFQKENIHIEQLEREAAESGCLSLKAERLKSFYAFFGPLYSSLALGYIDTKPAVSIFGPGSSTRSLSCYVMRSFYLPPGKNCIQRGWEKLKQLVVYSPHPSSVPELARNYSVLEDLAKEN